MSAPDRQPPRPTPHTSLRLEIDPVIETAERMVVYVDRQLPMHPGLARAARGVAQAALEAKRVSRKLGRPLGWHRLPALFLVASVGLLCVWVYWHFFHTSTLVIAVSTRDAVQLKQRVDQRVRIVPEETLGSRESIEKLRRGSVDLAFIQGGVEIPEEFPRTRLQQSELVLLFLRDGINQPAQVRKIFTSSRGQGSHSLAQIFTRIWGNDGDVTYVHGWRELTDQPEYRLADDVDAVLVVKDPMSHRFEGLAARLEEQGFRIVTPDIGAMNLRLNYLSEVEIRPGYLDPVGGIPRDPVESYEVATYLVARPGLTPRELAAAQRLTQAANLFPSTVQPAFDAANEVAQGIEAVLGIGVYIGLAFLALLGLDIVAYRRRFNELNSLVSLISMHQSSKDVLGCSGAQQARHVDYLTICSDLLGLIAVITGYYAQENSSLMYNRLLQIINDRCNGLKINIQLKILHALIEVPGVGPHCVPSASIAPTPAAGQTAPQAE